MPEDREAALEWLTEDALRCPGCALPRDETMVNEDDAPFYEVHAITCHACAMRQLVQEDAIKEARRRGNDPPPGRYYAVRERVM